MGRSNMKQDEIHERTNNKEIRDYCGKQLNALAVKGHYGDVDYFERALKDVLEQLKGAKQYNALLQIIEMNGWERFDVSENLENYKSSNYFEFIGTEKEYGALCSLHNLPLEE